MNSPLTLVPDSAHTPHTSIESSVAARARERPRSAHLSVAARRAFGGLLPLIDQPTMRDVLVQVRDGRGVLWVDQGRGVEEIEQWQAGPAVVAALARGLIAAGGRHLDELCPMADVRLGDGIRVHAVLPPVGCSGAAVSIRLPALRRVSWTEMVSSGFCDATAEHLLRSAVLRRQNVLITGATGSGKTTLLSALLGLVPGSERIITIEDVAELRIAHPHVVGLEARQANSEGAGEVGVDRLLREALRMRPDRIVLGECRGAETVTLLAAMNTGHDGGAGTLHASALAEVPARLEMLGRLAGLDAQTVARQVTAAIGLVVHVERVEGAHRLAALGSFVRESGNLSIVPFSRGRALRRAG
ncbi:Flp pilus assembly complex ATPase component TadA [Leucobacter sp. CSA2]|uniref:Flp pilus assembly complex ATPase component TadA n=1 Tax=Leucobacter edaphi TaxID=2796472 RepID=A0A934UY40_9MICO|nr:ATPase, T2SS/T4P/T4SS family [Leucobacter edaphi]MBK0422346.1 Flp pilus assembly complex ATPase component TadA [Leucobacter edaphi]